MTMPLRYYEKEERDGHPVFVSPNPAQLALRGTGMDLTQLRDLMLGSFARAGLEGVAGALEGATGEELAGLVGVLGDELLRGSVPGAPAGAMPGAGGAGPGGAGQGEVTGEMVSAVLSGVEEGDFKGALLQAAKRVGMNAAVNALEAATGVQVGLVVDALRDADNFGDAMGNLAKALPSLAGGTLARAAGLPGLPGAGPGPGQGPGPLGGPPGAQGMAGNVMDPQAMMASGALSGAASAGMSMLAGQGMRALTGLMSGGDQELEDAFSVLRQLQGRARLEGTETVNGRESWVLVVVDPSGIELGGGDFAPSSLTLYLDREELLPRGGVMAGEMEVQGERRPVTVQLTVDDYREVGGMLHPFRTEVAFEGLGPIMSEEEREELRENLEEARESMERMREQREQMEKQMAQLPPAQREMMEQQMEAMPAMQEQALQQMEAMTEGGSFERMTMTVTELRVNEGPPEELVSPQGPPGVPMMMPGMPSPP